MSRKLTRDQNDISIIIGNLPKRLQKKIADETGANCCFADQVQEKNNGDSDVEGDVSEWSPEGNQNVPQIDLFLRMNAPMATDDNNETHVAETPIKDQVVVTSNIAKKEILEINELVAIPGILRIKTGKCVNAVLENSCKRRGVGENGRKHRSLRSGGRIAPVQMTAYAANCTQPPWFHELLQKDISYVQMLPQLHDYMTNLMQRRIVLENWSDFCKCCTKLQQLFSQLLLNHLKFCCEQKVETYFWKLLFYNVIEYLKNTNATSDSTQAIYIINNGLEFYTNLFSQLNQKYASSTIDRHATDENYQHKFEFIAKVSAQKLLICLGDLSRYKTKLLQMNDFTDACNFYERAQRLIPTNGIPYNQLAILSIYNRKKFDAIYFHMRSLMSSNAIYSARESLQVLFDEIRKKCEERETKSSPLHKKANHGDKKSKSMRKEVWIHPDGVRCLHRTDINGNKSTLTEENCINELSADELLRRFTTQYLYVIGKFFTGVGMEKIQDHQRKLLIQFSVILRRNPLIISSHRLLKIVALNVFIMEHNKEKDTRREIRYHGFIFCNQMFGLVLRKCNELFVEDKEVVSKLTDNRFQDLTNLLPFAKIWCDWLAQNSLIWEPLRCEEETICDPWAELQLSFNNMEKILSLQHINYRDIVNVFLDEDIYLVGFTPISKITVNLSDRNSLDKEAQYFARIAKIFNFKNLYRQHQERLDSKNELNFCLENLNAQMKIVLESVKNNDDEDEDDNSENVMDNGLNRMEAVKEAGTLNVREPMYVENAQVSQLSKLKKELEAKSNVTKMYTAKLEEILKFVDTNLYIEVRPKYLLPDTNCFIDCLEDFEKLVKEHKRYILIIPLTVVKELDGLAKGVKLESYKMSLQKNRIHHFDDVSTRAKKSLDFIKITNNNVKCATTKGSIINASLFSLVEEEHVSNDDKILATALALSKTMSTETSKDGKCFIQTELVLITTDRNLRVKALSRNLTVSELSEFQQWANDCKL